MLRDRIKKLPLSEDGIVPYDYQIEAVEKLFESLAKGNNKVVLALATGAGKSIIARMIVELANEKDSQCLYTAHRAILRTQMRDTLAKCENVIVDTLQTHKNREYENIKLIIADEVHYGSGTKMQEAIFEKYPEARVIGLSATPIKADGSKLDDWDEVIDVIQLCDLVRIGKASPVKVLAPASIDRSQFKVARGDYVEKDVEKEVTKSSIVSDVVGKWERYAKELRSLFYCLNIKHSEMICEQLVSRGYRAKTYHSKIKAKEREEIMIDFKRCDIDILCSIESLTTGVDIPDVYCAVLASPTKSTIKAVQIYGRVTRLNKKDPQKEALILDMANVIDDTIHPVGRMNFNQEQEQEGKTHEGCGGRWRVYKRDGVLEDGVNYITTQYRCDKCGAMKIKEDESIVRVNFCEKCDEEIEDGTAKVFTLEMDEKLSVIATCPHCGDMKTIRSIDVVDVELIEKTLKITPANINTWDDVLTELRKARKKDGSKYHAWWAKKHVIDVLKFEGYSPQDVRLALENLLQKGYGVGGIVAEVRKIKSSSFFGDTLKKIKSRVV